ncbi:MAG: LCP family protein [Actinomycetota bacterium]|nr:LCP family protein [Actinomycetota bacterium]
MAGQGRRRRTFHLDASSPTRQELAREAEHAVSRRARLRVAWAIIGAAGIIGAAVAATLVVRQPSGASAEAVASQEGGTSLLAVVTEPSGRATSIALIATRPGDPTQTVLFPPSLLVTLPGYGDGLISQVVEFGGPELARLSVSNLLGVRIDATVVVSAASLQAALPGALAVELHAPLLVPDQGGERVLAATGRAPREPAVVESLLTEQGTGDELEWLKRQGGVWRALLRAAGDQSQLAERLLSRTDAPARAADLLVAAGRAEELLVTAVPASRIAVGGETERYQVSGEEAADFVEGRLEFLRLRAEPRPRVEVLNGNGQVGTTHAVAEALIRRGFRVVRTDNAERFDYQQTQVIAQGRDYQQEALAVQEVLGRGEVILELRRPSGVVDLTIIVGQDIPAEEG